MLISECKQTQPYVVMKGMVLFVVVDASFIEVGQNINRAIELLYKVHYIFDVSYEKSLAAFFNFFDFFIFKHNAKTLMSVCAKLKLKLNKKTVL
jgi:hypothetical protein